MRYLSNFQLHELAAYITIEIANDSGPSTFDMWPLSSDTAGLCPSGLIKRCYMLRTAAELKWSGNDSEIVRD